MYFKRQIEKTLSLYKKSFPSVLITGCRQSGKTTLLKNSDAFSSFKYLSFDNPDNEEEVTKDAKSFISKNRENVIFDEIQRVPKIFRYLKMQIDSDRKNGIYALSGSQNFILMQDVSESLAGRIGILSLYPLSLREIYSDSFSLPFIPTEKYLQERNPKKENNNPTNVWEHIIKGSFPEVWCNGAKREVFYPSYVSTYIERDVRNITGIENYLTFLNFLRIIASRSGSILNYNDISKESELDLKTVKKWIGVLELSNIIYLLPCYYGNIEKRLIKSPKLYFVDTGLMAYLTKWFDSSTLSVGNMNGQFFETFIVSEIVKSFSNNGIDPPLYYYRDIEKNEVDLLIEQDGVLYPIEIKATSSPSLRDASSFRYLKTIKDRKIANPIIVSNNEEARSIGDNILAIPYTYI